MPSTADDGRYIRLPRMERAIQFQKYKQDTLGL